LALLASLDFTVLAVLGESASAQTL